MLAPTTTTKEDELIAARASESVRSREADFVRAQAYSTKVRMLKWSLPALGVVMALAFGGYTFLSRVPELNYDIASVAYADGKLVMANPKLNGVTSQNRPYSMTAARATQDPAKQHIVELEGIDAMIPIDLENSAAIVAERGVYDSDANTLNIDSAFSVTASNGVAAKLGNAKVSIDEGTLFTDRPVEITRNGSKITADSLSVLENGKVIVFEKRVRLNITPDALRPAGKPGEQHAGN
jgi:lipopolysaccharide export system protein LptC